MNFKKFLILILLTITVTKSFSHEHQVDVQHLIDSIYNAHREEVVHNATILGEDAFVTLSLKYKFNEEDRLKLEKYCVDKEIVKYIMNYMNITPIQRVMLKESIDASYRDSINMILIPRNNYISGYAISLTLRLADYLKLSNDTRKVLMDNALDFARRRYKNPYTNFAVDEMKVLRKYINRDSLMDILVTKNSDEAIRRSEAEWDTLKKANLTKELDSAYQVTTTRFYYEKEMAIRDMYIGEDEVRDRNLADIYGKRTKLMEMYNAYIEKKRLQAKQKKEENKIGDEFTW